MPAATTYPSARAAVQQLACLLLAAVAFERLFWQQQVGLNGLLFMLVAVGLQWWPARQLPHSRPCWLAAGGALLSGMLMAVYGSLLAAVAGWVSVALLLAFARLPALRSVGYALLTSLANVRYTRLALRQVLQPVRRAPGRARRGWFYGRLLVVPVVVLGVFHVLFALANPRYARFSDQFLDAIGRAVSWLLEAVSVGHLLFWLLAVAVGTALVVRNTVRRYAEREARHPEYLTRQRRPGRRFFRLLDLRKQYLVALLLFGLLNGLLAVVNAIDINWLWLNYQPATTLEMKQFVHEGTYVLIFSILLAMSLVLWAFRGNLNFYAPGRPWLRGLATAWVLQNAVLALSVGLRNYYYIVATGLAYRRIGVCAFLLLTLFGLGTIVLKIWQRRSVYSLVRLNGWAAYALLLLLAAGNWEVWMVRYNVQRSRWHIDLNFLLALPGRSLPALQARRSVLAAPATTSLLALQRGIDDQYVDVTPAFALQALNARTRRWRAYHGTHRSWQSWNYADWRAYQQTGQNKSY